MFRSAEGAKREGACSGFSAATVQMTVISTAGSGENNRKGIALSFFHSIRSKKTRLTELLQSAARVGLAAS